MSALRNLEFSFDAPVTSQGVPAGRTGSLADELGAFQEFGTTTRQLEIHGPVPDGQGVYVPVFVNEFWTARQRQASSLHEISYRACFKPQLPRFF
ncbi:MAG TPA: hypothetical protein VLD18_16725, partial [Verrucomicrobiae bacterium]|nr:hypothetical protein [Verrucomicrobiae bacterium]